MDGIFPVLKGPPRLGSEIPRSLERVHCEAVGVGA